MYNNLIHSSRQPFNFEDGLTVKNILLSSKNGATQIGCYLTPEDTEATPVQIWLLSLLQTLASLSGIGTTFTSPDQPTTNSSSFTANTKFVQTLLAEKLALVLGNAPTTLNTLKKLANAMGNDPAFFSTLQTSLSNKISKLDIQKDTISTTIITDTNAAWSAALATPMVSLVDGMIIRAKSTAAVTTQPTLVITNVVGDIAHAVSLQDGGLVRAGDIPSSGYWMLLQWSAGASKWLLLNPAFSARSKYATNQQTIDGLLTNVAITPQGLTAIVNSLLASSAGAMGTVAKLAQAINSDGNLFTTLSNALSTKAPLASPTLTGLPKVPTPVSTDSSKLIANTEFVQAVVAAKAAASATPNATQSVIGRILLANADKVAAGVDTSSGITPQLLKTVTNSYLLKTNASFAGYPRLPTQPAGTNNTTIANAEFVTLLYNTHIASATTTTAGMFRYATDAETLTPSLANLGITPKALQTVFNNIPATPDATTSTKGQFRLTTNQEGIDGPSSSLALTPAAYKAAITARFAASTGSFASPSISSVATAYVGSLFTFTITASPVAPATYIASFDVLVKSRDTNTWQLVANAQPASGNKLTYTITPSVAQVGIGQIQVKARDDRGNLSPLASKDFSVVQITVNPPTITFPVNNQVDVSHTPTFITSGFGLSVGVGSHMTTNWKLELIDSVNGNVLAWNSPNDTVNKTQISLIDNIVAAGYQYRLSVQYIDQTYGASAWTSVVYKPLLAGSNSLMQTIVSPTPVQNGWFGQPAVSKDGAWLAICAQVEKCVRIYKWNEVSSSYEYATMFQIDEPDPGNYTYGVRVSMNYAGDQIVVGCPRVAGITTVSTAIGYVYEYQRTGLTWAQTNKITSQTDIISGAGIVTYGDGVTLSRDGLHMVVQVSKGCVHFLAKQTNGSWLKVSEASHSGFTTDTFGTTVSFDGTATRVAVSAPGDKLNGSLGGRVYIYLRQANGTWTEETGVQPVSMSNSQLFGKGVALNAAGDTLLVGSPLRTNGRVAYCGSICVFKRTGASWSQLSERFQDTPTAQAGLGNHISWSDNEKQLVVSALYNASRSSDFGRVYYGTWDYNTNSLTFDSSMTVATAVMTYYGLWAILVPMGRRVLVTHPWATNTISQEGVVYVNNC